MPFYLTPAQQDLRALARRIANTAIAPRAAATDRDEAYPWANVAALHDAGLLGLTLPAELGGGGGSLLDAVLVSPSAGHRAGAALHDRRVAAGLEIAAGAERFRAAVNPGGLSSAPRVLYHPPTMPKPSPGAIPAP